MVILPKGTSDNRKLSLPHDRALIEIKATRHHLAKFDAFRRLGGSFMEKSVERNEVEAPLAVAPRWKLTLSLIVVLALAACQTTEPTPYQARTSGAGYSETSLGEGIFRVSFEGNAATPYKTVEDYLLYRAAEVADEHQADTFTVLSNTEPSTFIESRPEMTVCHYSPADFSKFVFYADTGEENEADQPDTRFEAYIDIKLGSPPAGADDAQVFRTKETLDYLASCVG